MIDYLPAIRELKIADIRVGVRLRPVEEAFVVGLVSLIEEFGFTVPIVVRRTKTGYSLIDGAHRLEAMKRRGSDTIPVRALYCNDVEQKALEASQNLATSSLSPLDDALFLAAYKAAYLQMHPETAQGVAGALAKHGRASELSSFADLIADKRRINPRRVQQLARAGAGITRAEADKLRLAPRKVAITCIQTLGLIHEADERAYVVEALSSGAAKNAGAARRAWASRNGPVERPAEPASKPDLKALLAAWDRASLEARLAFVTARGDDLADLGEGGDA